MIADHQIDVDRDSDGPGRWHAYCSCSEWDSGWVNSATEAANAWGDHLSRVLPNDPEAGER